MRRASVFVVIVILATIGVAPGPASGPALADPAPLACLGVTETTEPAVGDGATPGDASPAATVLTYGCYNARLEAASDVDGYRVYGTPVTVSVGIADEGACVHVTWFLGPPPSNAISRWMCDHDVYAVTWTGVHPMRLQLWYGPSPQMDGPTPYRIGVLPVS